MQTLELRRVRRRAGPRGSFEPTQTGTRGKGDDDIAVISDDQATVGSVVTLTGTVRLDKDFGAGYQYPVIIDGAKLK